MNKIKDVVIVGGGHIGLLAALSMAQKAHTQGIPLSVVLIDQSDPQMFFKSTYDGRTFALTDAAFGLLNEVGVWEHLAPYAEPIWHILVTEQHDLEGVHYEAKDHFGRPFGYIAESTRLRRLLIERLTHYPGITFLAPEKVKAITPEPGHITLELESQKVIKARLMVGADGAHSLVRERMGLESHRIRYTHKAMVAHVAHTYDHRGWALESFHPEGPFAVLPLPPTDAYPHQSGLVWCGQTAHIDALSTCPPPEFLASLGHKMDEERYGKLELISDRWTYPLSVLVVPTIVAHRTALIGDAAHGIHPVAGQGLNLGLRDVMVLAYEIVLSASLGLDPGSLTMLETYQRQRRGDILSLLGTTHGLIRFFCNDSKPLRSLRRLGLRLVDHIPPLKDFLVRRAMQG